MTLRRRVASLTPLRLLALDKWQGTFNNWGQCNFGGSCNHLSNIASNNYNNNYNNNLTGSTYSSSFVNQSTLTCSDSQIEPQIEVPIRFNGRWEKVVKPGGGSTDMGGYSKYAYTRYDLVLQCKKIEKVGATATATGAGYHNHHLLPNSTTGVEKSFLVELSVEKRGNYQRSNLTPQRFDNNRFGSQQRFMKPGVSPGIGDKMESIGLVIDNENIEKILQFDGEKKEMIKIEETKEGSLPIVGLIGMEKRYLHVRLQQGELKHTTYLEPRHAILFLHLTRFVFLSLVKSPFMWPVAMNSEADLLSASNAAPTDILLKSSDIELESTAELESDAPAAAEFLLPSQMLQSE